jgi:2-polyprenyl-3-methyl-5-hydroxy-6-metoxy-1,4-benzoquinol methylase
MNSNATKPPGYETKNSSYFEQIRSEMLPFVPPECRRLLDVGCGDGNFGELLKQTRSLEVWGIEPVTAAAASAATKLDRVIEGTFSSELDLPSNHFDAIVFNDVLEHLFDPTAALRLARTLLRPGGAIIASIPNIRHFPTLWEVIVHGEWRYQDYGILDRTHLRFFTKKSIIALLTDCELTVARIEGINPNYGGSRGKWRCFRMIKFLTFDSIEDMQYLQFAVVAKTRG